MVTRVCATGFAPVRPSTTAAFLEVVGGRRERFVMSDDPASSTPPGGGVKIPTRGSNSHCIPVGNFESGIFGKVTGDFSKVQNGALQKGVFRRGVMTFPLQVTFCNSKEGDFGVLVTLKSDRSLVKVTAFQHGKSRTERKNSSSLGWE